MCALLGEGETQTKNADGNKQNLSTVPAQRDLNGQGAADPEGSGGKKIRNDISGKVRKQARRMNFSYQPHINIGSLIVANV